MKRAGGIFVVFILLVIVVSPAHGQNISLLDSLHRQLKKSSGVTRFQLLNDIGFEYRLSYPDSTIYYCNQAYTLGLELNVDKELSKPLSFIGLANAYKGDYKSSFEFHLKSVEVAQEQNDSAQLAFCYNNFGRLFYDQGDMTRAYDNLIKSQAIFEKLNDPVGLAYVYRSLSNIYRSQQDYSKALEMALKAYQLRKKTGDPRGLLSALMELGTVYSEMKSSLDANRCFEQADSIAVKINDHISLAEIKLGWGEFLSANDSMNHAAELADEAYKIIIKSDNIRLLPRANLLMGIVSYKLNDFKKSRIFLDKVVGIGSQTHLDLQRDANYYLGKINEREGKLAEAAAYTNKYLILKESLQSVELARQIEKLQFQLEIEKREREYELLKVKQAEADAAVRQKQLENIILIVITGFVTALFLMQWRNSKKRQGANVKLASQNEKIERQRLEISHQNEKLEKRNVELSELNHEKDTLMNIVAHDLKSPLNRIKGLSDLIEMEGELNANQRKYLGLIKDSTRSGLDLITDLLDVNALEVNREPEFSIFNLSTFLTERANAFRPGASAKEIDIVLEQHVTEPVESDQEYLSRILDNLISNAIKFSPRRTVIQIVSEMKGEYFSISVKDQGPGFNPADIKFMYQKFKKLTARPTGGESSNGLGLAIVKILVDRLDGKIDLRTEIGKGSTFEILLPLRPIVSVV
ncbi:MAG: tetratricopeptide repeat-containing sensor histidine kinase [Cyclobacteriaceae bacterium]|nr:tetratricopeptide repeat-containing sensor histidine kinase [Cyclobacteriaceae bacterium]